MRYFVVVYDTDGEHVYPVADEEAARELAAVFEEWGGRTEIRIEDHVRLDEQVESPQHERTSHVDDGPRPSR